MPSAGIVTVPVVLTYCVSLTPPSSVAAQIAMRPSTKTRGRSISSSVPTGVRNFCRAFLIIMARKCTAMLGERGSALNRWSTRMCSGTGTLAS